MFGGGLRWQQAQFEPEDSQAKAQDWQERWRIWTAGGRTRTPWAAPERVAKHHDKGKLDAPRTHRAPPRPRHAFAKSARSLAAIPADGIVIGSGLIDGPPVMVGAEDFTTLAGTIGAGGNSKRYRIAELAVRDKIPLVMMLEGAGFRPTGGITDAPPPT